MTRKRTQLYRPREDLTEFENFEALTKKLIAVKKTDLDKALKDDKKKASKKQRKK